MNHLNIKIYGRVQGISFRWYTKRKAEALGIFGFARNEPDGSVYVEAEGEKKELDKFVGWLKKGPLFSKVERVAVDENETKGYNTFEIRY